MTASPQTEPVRISSIARKARNKITRKVEGEDRCPTPGCENQPTAVYLARGEFPAMAVPCRECYVRYIKPAWDQDFGPPNPREKAPRRKVPTLDPEAFRVGFDKLAKRHRRSLEPDVATGYYNHLKGKVSDLEARRGLAHAFSHTVHFPTPDELLQMCRGQNHLGV